MHYLLPILSLLTMGQTVSVGQNYEHPPHRFEIKGGGEEVGWPDSNMNKTGQRSFGITVDAPWESVLHRKESLDKNNIVTDRQMGKREWRAWRQRKWEERGGVEVNGVWVLPQELELAKRALNIPSDLELFENTTVLQGELATNEPAEKEMSFFQAWGIQIGIATAGLLVIGGLLAWGFKRTDWGSIGT